jgi:hypothetical protein
MLDCIKRADQSIETGLKAGELGQEAEHDQGTVGRCEVIVMTRMNQDSLVEGTQAESELVNTRG